ncbi:MAG TPA: acyl carrier protein [Spirochaetota bacterium]|nr:acyl carrier protein [Spirochaetota bacterium]
MANFDKIKDIIVEKLSCKPEDVTQDTAFADLGADSLDLVELIMGLEEEYGIEIPDEEAEKIKTVKDAMVYIDSHSN